MVEVVVVVVVVVEEEEMVVMLVMVLLVERNKNGCNLTAYSVRVMKHTRTHLRSS